MTSMDGNSFSGDGLDRETLSMLYGFYCGLRWLGVDGEAALRIAASDERMSVEAREWMCRVCMRVYLGDSLGEMLGRYAPLEAS